MQIPPLTRSIGSAERSMRELLDQKLQCAQLSFAEWTALVFTSVAPLSLAELVQRQLAGHVVADVASARASIDGLVHAGFVTRSPGDVLAHAEKGEAVFKRLSVEVEGIARDLYGDLPIADLQATHRTLLEIAKRANKLLPRRD